MFSKTGMQVIQIVRYRNKYTKIISILGNYSRFYSEETYFKRKPLFRRPSLPEGGNTSQYFIPPPIELANQKILDYILEKNPKTLDEWHDAKEFFYTEIPLISDENYSSIIMHSLLGKNNIISAQHFMKYLYDSNLKPNILCYLQYMALCGKNLEQCRQEEVLEIYKEIQNVIENSPVLDKKRALYVIQGLCGTNKWRLAFDYLKKIPQGPNTEMKNSLASAAIRNDDENLAWEIVTKWIKNDDTITNQTIHEFFKHAKKLQLIHQKNADNFLLKFFKYLQQRDIIINKDEANLLEDYFKCHSLEWRISYTKVNRIGECTSCKNSLEYMQLSDQDFEYLKISFLEKSVKKRDIFINTTEEEFNRYLSFLERRKPYHIVVDALNVAYTVNDVKTGRNLSYHLLQAVKGLSKKSRKILVLGREQMIGWPKTIMKRISQRADLFLTSNASQDDPFTLYAALASGPHTCILTMDLMRDHLSCLNNPRLIHLFKKWQQSHQILMTVDKDNDMKFIEPLRHGITIQGNMEKGWHIPVEDNIFRESYEELNNWLCIERICT